MDIQTFAPELNWLHTFISTQHSTKLDVLNTLSTTTSNTEPTAPSSSTDSDDFVKIIGDLQKQNTELLSLANVNSSLRQDNFSLRTSLDDLQHKYETVSAELQYYQNQVKQEETHDFDTNPSQISEDRITELMTQITELQNTNNGLHQKIQALQKENEGLKGELSSVNQAQPASMNDNVRKKFAALRRAKDEEIRQLKQKIQLLEG
ncbi:hypothetical protein P9112_011200 [Eukaryota sp. TZLM1-RC]